MKNKWVKFIAYIIGFPILWNAVDYVWDVLIQKNQFQFKVTANIITPVVIACIIGYFSYLRDKKKQ